MKKFLILLLLVLGTNVVFTQIVQPEPSIKVTWSDKNPHRSEPVVSYGIHKDSLARLLLPHPTMFSPVMEENPDSFNFSLIDCSHPEMKVDEVYLTNIYTGLYWQRSEDGGLTAFGATEEVAVNKTLEKIPFTNKRVGRQAYDYSGKMISLCVPVFVKRSELILAGILKE